MIASSCYSNEAFKQNSSFISQLLDAYFEAQNRLNVIFDEDYIIHYEQIRDKNYPKTKTSKRLTDITESLLKEYLPKFGL